jgi:preprotein translocase subunit SecY
MSFFPGSLFLALIAVFPAIVVKSYGCSTILGNVLEVLHIIMVGVAIDTMQQINSYLNKHYDGLMKVVK